MQTWWDYGSWLTIYSKYADDALLTFPTISLAAHAKIEMTKAWSFSQVCCAWGTAYVQTLMLGVHLCL